ncbi:TetR/AcrR family transcriptional regulator [Streptomyces inhibens]|uniref:TetR/AcrR family transcriptional regulator n=1 Tax=Streptomyces inhibens TaxID=2293571 RepID=UPI00402B0225
MGAKPGRAGVRLSPEVIVEAAVRIAARGRPDGLTGRALGEELGVDRSAVWRHFTDKDALLLAVGDRLLAMAAEQMPTGLAPRPLLEKLARAVVDVFEAHPYVGAAIACRTTRGPGEFALVETMLAALGELGLGEGDVARYQRMLADTVLAYAGMRAGYAVLPQEVRAGDEHAWAGAYATAAPGRYPAIAAHVHQLAAVDGDMVFETMMEAFWLAVDARARTTAPPTEPTGGHDA